MQKLHSLTSWIQSLCSSWPVFILMPLKFASVYSLCFLPALLCPFIHDERVVTEGALWPFPADNRSSISWACQSQEKGTMPKNLELINFSLAFCLSLPSFLSLLSAPSSPHWKYLWIKIFSAAGCHAKCTQLTYESILCLMTSVCLDIWQWSYSMCVTVISM